MKLVSLNTVCNASTGKIMGSISRKASKSGFDTTCIYGRRKGYKDLKCIKVGGLLSLSFHVFITTLFDLQGYGSYFKTKKVIRLLKKIDPDIIHLHNIHGYYINYKVLFNYLKKEYKGKIYWTFHDCLPFTGHCAYFDYVKCSKWKNICYKCPNKKQYPISLLFDCSHKNYLFKKDLFTNIPNLTIITPSNWMNNLVKSSFLKEYPVVTINNGIDLDVFKPTHDEEIYLKYKIPKDKKILLGIANKWEKRKGLDDFISLSQKIDKEYVIVLVGVDKKIQKRLNEYKNIITLDRTDNQHHLAALYTSAYALINPTYEDNYPTVNIEALACHTRVISYDTGGCIEQAKNNPNMYLVNKTTLEQNVSVIIDLLDKINDTYFDTDTSFYSDSLFADEIIKLYRK